MARFYASIEGNRGSSTRIGTASSGISGHIRGWNVGAQVDCRVDGDDNDVVEVYATGGSNNGHHQQILARIMADGTIMVAEGYPTFHTED